MTLKMGRDVRPSVRPSVNISLITEPTILRLHRMILDMCPHNPSIPIFAISGHMIQKWGQNAVMAFWPISSIYYRYLFSLSLLRRVFPNFVLWWYQTLVRTIAQRSISRFPDRGHRSGVRYALAFRISDIYLTLMCFSQSCPASVDVKELACGAEGCESESY